MARTPDRDSISHDDAEVARRGAPARVLADPAGRQILRALGEGARTRLTAGEICRQARGTLTQRLIRDRLRELDRAQLVRAVDADPAVRWSLTPAGRDLHRLLSVVERIVGRAAGLSENHGARDDAVQRTLRALSDPVVQRAIAALADDTPVDPVTLERRCHPTPRRTLYRRLQAMVETRVVTRTTTSGVPRTSTYTLARRWRPAAVLWMLPAWWESRDHQDGGHARAADIVVPVRVLLPVVDASALPARTRVRWIVDDAGRQEALTLAVCDGRLVSATASAPAAAEVGGSPAAWAAALISDQRSALDVAGDEALARAVSDLIRSALLAYVR